MAPAYPPESGEPFSAAPLDPTRRSEEAQDGHGRGRFAAAGLACQSQDLARSDVEAQSINSHYPATPAHVGHPQVFDRQHGRGDGVRRPGDSRSSSFTRPSLPAVKASVASGEKPTENTLK